LEVRRGGSARVSLGHGSCLEDEKKLVVGEHRIPADLIMI
jgi:hypothetical protein